MKASAQAIDRHISAVAHPLPIAAITYDGHAVADALLADFALGLQHKGWRIRGLVQRDTDGSKAGMMLVDLEKGTRYPLFQALGPASCSCALDTESIAAASAVLRRALDERADHVEIAVQRDSHLYWNGEPSVRDELEQRAARIAAQVPDTEIHLKGDAAVPYGVMARTLSVLARQGLTRIGFVTDPFEGASAAN